jgi:peptidoglycan-N-acetylglucosamine deacetylase
VRTFYILLFILIGLFTIYSVIPNVFVRLLHWGCLWTGPKKRCVALTFDDGPDPKYTPRILDVLNEAGVKATFFVIAEKAIRNREIVLRMIREGHDVQVHGYTHSLVPLLLPARTREQLLGAANVLRKTFGIKTSLYRPTWGLCNLITLYTIRRSKHTLVTWSIMIGDWRRLSSSELLSRVIRNLHPGGIIVLHDSDETFGSERGAPDQVIQFLPQLIGYLKREGYEIQKVVDWTHTEACRTPSM